MRLLVELSENDIEGAVRAYVSLMGYTVSNSGTAVQLRTKVNNEMFAVVAVKEKA